MKTLERPDSAALRRTSKTSGRKVRVLKFEVSFQPETGPETLNIPSIITGIFKAVSQPEAEYRLTKLCMNLVRSGVSREHLLAIFELVRVILQAHDREDEEDVVLEVMDCLVGYCAPRAKI